MQKLHILFANNVRVNFVKYYLIKIFCFLSVYLKKKFLQLLCEKFNLSALQLMFICKILKTLFYKKITVVSRTSSTPRTRVFAFKRKKNKERIRVVLIKIIFLTLIIIVKKKRFSKKIQQTKFYTIDLWLIGRGSYAMTLPLWSGLPRGTFAGFLLVRGIRWRDSFLSRRLSRYLNITIHNKPYTHVLNLLKLKFDVRSLPVDNFFK